MTSSGPFEIYVKTTRAPLGRSRARSGAHDSSAQLVMAHIDAAREELVDRGLDATPVRSIEDGVRLDGHGERWSSFMFLSDPAGSGWTIQEKPAAVQPPGRR